MKKFFNNIITVSLCSVLLLVINQAQAMQKALLNKENIAARNLETAQNLYNAALEKMSLITRMSNLLEQDPTTRTMGSVDTLRSAQAQLIQLVEQLQDLTANNAMFDVKFKLNLQKRNFFEKAANQIARAHGIANNTVATIPPVARVEYSANKYRAINPETLTDAQRQTMIEKITALNTLFNEKVVQDTKIPEHSRNELRGKLIALERQFTRN